MNTHLLEQASVLDIEDQIELVEAIWNNIVSHGAAPSLTNTQKTELDRRLAYHLENPNDVDFWSEVKAAALAKIGQWSLPISFHRAASAEFIEASAWYEERQLGLAAKFMAEIERCVSLASEHPFQYATFHKDIRCIVANRFPTAFIFVWRKVVLLSWQYFIAGETPLLGRLGACRTIDMVA
jgi:putative addiction module component (TIGR02574 family)